MSKKPQEIEFSNEQIALIKTQIAPKATDDELKLFLHQCKRTGLDPFARQIYCVHRKDGVKDKMSIQTSIDGFRLIAERTGQYGGQGKPVFEYDNNGFPVKCELSVYKFKGSVRYEAAIGVAYYSEYVQTKKEYQNNQPTGRVIPTEMWATKPHIMLGKVTEALALRKAFPQELSGLYTEDEMGQANNNETYQAQLPASTAVPFNPQYTNAPQAQPQQARQQQGTTPTPQQQPAQAPITPFTKVYGDAEAIAAVLDICKTKQEMLDLYANNKNLVDKDAALKAGFKKKDTQFATGGKIIIADSQFNELCTRIRNGELVAYDEAQNAYLLNEKQAEYLKEVYGVVARVEAAILRKDQTPETLLAIIDACTNSRQVLTLHQNNAFIADRDAAVSAAINNKLRALKQAA